jgi:hypothetical protein
MEIPLAWGVGERFKSSKRKRGAITRLSYFLLLVSFGMPSWKWVGCLADTLSCLSVPHNEEQQRNHNHISFVVSILPRHSRVG